MLGGAPVRKPTFRATPRGRRPGEWQQLTVSVPGRCGTVYTAPRDVFPILHCESSSGQPRGTRAACVLLLAAGAERAFFTSHPTILYKENTLGGDTRRMCITSGWRVGSGRASSPNRLAARSRGVKRVALRHSRAGGIAVGAADFEVLEDPVRIRPLRPTRTGKGRERGHSP